MKTIHMHVCTSGISRIHPHTKHLKLKTADIRKQVLYTCVQYAVENCPCSFITSLPKHQAILSQSKISVACLLMNWKHTTKTLRCQEFLTDFMIPCVGLPTSATDIRLILQSNHNDSKAHIVWTITCKSSNKTKSFVCASPKKPHWHTVKLVSIYSQPLIVSTPG